MPPCRLVFGGIQMGLLEVKKLSLTLGGKKILNDCTVDFWEGHVHAIVGPNGAGKSTLAYTIMGLSGYRDGKSILGLGIDERARMGITLGWQEPARFEGLTIKNFIRAAAKDKTIASIKDALEKVALNPDEYLTRAVDKTLSGGERKRVELASLLAMRPRIVLLDEPDSGIDVEALEKIFEAIHLLKSYGATVILITHEMAVKIKDAEIKCKEAEHAFLMCRGEIFDKGSVDKISGYFENKCIPCERTAISSSPEGN